MITRVGGWIELTCGFFRYTSWWSTPVAPVPIWLAADKVDHIVSEFVATVTTVADSLRRVQRDKAIWDVRRVATCYN